MNRIRGGWLGPQIKNLIPFWGTTVARLSLSLVVSLPLFLFYSWYMVLLFIGLFYVGLVPGWGSWIYMGKPLEDILALTGRGLIITVAAGIALKLYIFSLSGLSMGIVYYIANQINWDYVDIDNNYWIGSDWGELLFGGVLGLALAINLIYLFH